MASYALYNYQPAADPWVLGPTLPMQQMQAACSARSGVQMSLGPSPTGLSPEQLYGTNALAIVGVPWRDPRVLFPTDPESSRKATSHKSTSRK